jgi:hypothetical protein
MNRGCLSAGAVLIFVLFALLVVGGIWFAYTHGMVGGSTTIIEKQNTTQIVPAPAPPAK